jgi:hypothetical protein
MGNGYKAALDRFEKAVLGQMDGRPEAEQEYERAHRVLVGKLNYRQLAAEQRAAEQRADRSSKVGDGTPDAALAIAEHAFRAGYEAGVEDALSGGHGGGPDVERAWSTYEPPEDIKALS